MAIQWFPGHMAKARREIEEKIKLVDIVIELVDARAPYSTKNPIFDDIIKVKPRLVVLTKKDLADEPKTKAWLEYYKQQGFYTMAVNLQNFNEYKLIIQMCREALKEKMERDKARGLKPRPIRAMVLGIPNVGKSTFINRLANRKAAVTGNKPGVTKSQQLIKVGNDFELLDTPGVLWPKFEDERVAKNLAITGSIKSSILPTDEVFNYGILALKDKYPQALVDRYKIDVNTETDDFIEYFFETVSEIRHIKPVRGILDYSRVMDLVTRELLDGQLGGVTWEVPSDYE